MVPQEVIGLVRYLPITYMVNIVYDYLRGWSTKHQL